MGDGRIVDGEGRAVLGTFQDLFFDVAFLEIELQILMFWDVSKMNLEFLWLGCLSTSALPVSGITCPSCMVWVVFQLA